MFSDIFYIVFQLYEIKQTLYYWRQTVIWQYLVLFTYRNEKSSCGWLALTIFEKIPCTPHMDI